AGPRRAAARAAGAPAPPLWHAVGRGGALERVLQPVRFLVLQGTDRAEHLAVLDRAPARAGRVRGPAPARARPAAAVARGRRRGRGGGGGRAARALLRV